MIHLQCHPAMEEQFCWGVGRGVVCLLALMHLFGLEKLFSGDNVLTDCTQYQSVLTAGNALVFQAALYSLDFPFLIL